MKLALPMTTTSSCLMSLPREDCNCDSLVNVIDVVVEPNVIPDNEPSFVPVILDPKLDAKVTVVLAEANDVDEVPSASPVVPEALPIVILSPDRTPSKDPTELALIILVLVSTVIPDIDNDEPKLLTTDLVAEGAS